MGSYDKSPGGGQDTPVFLPGESPWTEEPGGLWGCKESDRNERLTHTEEKTLQNHNELICLT